MNSRLLEKGHPSKDLKEVTESVMGGESFTYGDSQARMLSSECAGMEQVGALVAPVGKQGEENRREVRVKLQIEMFASFNFLRGNTALYITYPSFSDIIRPTQATLSGYLGHLNVMSEFIGTLQSIMNHTF